MKKQLYLVFFLLPIFGKAQKVENIFVNLYTDSLKKGTYNYINIDGKLSNGRYIPLDSTHIRFTASSGFFKGNSLFIPFDFKEDKVNIRVELIQNPAVFQEFVIWVKKVNSSEKLKTVDEILKTGGAPAQKSRKKKRGLFG